jgi:EAL domain-containing protein (putative c-di-GMP-specific phosphodiesterase class I)
MRRRAEDLQGSSARERAELEARFERALAGLWMAFQPIVEVTSHRVFAFEALLRTSEDSLRRPDILIAVAERLGRVPELGRAVRAAVARAAPEAPVDALLFVNLHGLELGDDELYAPSSPLSAIASRVVLEITERIALDEGSATQRVAELRRLGYRIAVDDLGAGYAALGSLASLEPEIVKLDMSLIRGIDRHQTKRRVVGAIATLCRELGSQVIAEGIETAEEQHTVLQAGIELIQGFFIARPAPNFLGPKLPGT